MDYDDSGEDPEARPYLSLMEAVLGRAVLDIIRPENYCFGHPHSKEAALWMFSTNEVFPFSFTWICQGVKLDPKAVRTAVWLQLEDVFYGTNSDPRIPQKLHELRSLVQRCSVCALPRRSKEASASRTKTASLVRAYKR